MAEVVWWSNTSTNITNGVPFVFGHLVQLAAPVMTLYQSDLFHDALWLNDHAVGSSFTFYWSVNETGTSIGLDADAAANRRDRYRVTVTLDERQRTTVNVEPMTPVTHTIGA